MTRTPREVFAHHARALAAGDLDEIVADYADDAVLITPDGVMRGKDGIRAAFTRLLDDVPNAAWNLKPRSMRVTSCSWSGSLMLRSPGSTTGSILLCSATA
ncbi:hypothetical protein JMUB5695_00245 [Mycobacterium heckeshornense]|nr:hypothetical protein JMUB5695_00245 [Mycobacterium heckeshornense]